MIKSLPSRSTVTRLTLPAEFSQSMLRWLAGAKRDVVCLQEPKAPSERFPEPAIQEAGYRAVWQGQKSWNGVAIPARGTAPTETRRGMPGDLDNAHSPYIEAAVLSGGHRLV